MNEELQQQVTLGIPEILAYVEATKDFAVEQAPLVVEEIVTWGSVSAWMGIWLGIFLVALAILGVMIGCGSTGEEGAVAGLIMFLGGAIPCLPVLITNIHKLYFIETATRLYVIETLRGML